MQGESWGLSCARLSGFKFITKLLSAGVRQAQGFREGGGPEALAVLLRSSSPLSAVLTVNRGQYFPGCWEDWGPRKSRGQRPPSPTGRPQPHT